MKRHLNEKQFYCPYNVRCRAGNIFTKIKTLKLALADI